MNTVVNQKVSTVVERIPQISFTLIGLMCLGAGVAAGIGSYASPEQGDNGGWLLAICIGLFGAWLLCMTWLDQVQRHKLGIICGLLAICTVALTYVIYSQVQEKNKSADEMFRLGKEHVSYIQGIRNRAFQELHFAHARYFQSVAGCARYQDIQPDNRFVKCMQAGADKGRLEAEVALESIFPKVRE